MSETTTVTRADFLLARIAEDEAKANDARRLQDYMPSGAWDLDRVLAECQAKRRIVELASVFDDQYEGIGLRMALRELAAIHADHPDYRDEWRP